MRYEPEECCPHGTPFDYVCQACIDEDNRSEMAAELNFDTVPTTVNDMSDADYRMGQEDFNLDEAEDE